MVQYTSLWLGLCNLVLATVISWLSLSPYWACFYINKQVTEEVKANPIVYRSVCKKKELVSVMPVSWDGDSSQRLAPQSLKSGNLEALSLLEIYFKLNSYNLISSFFSCLQSICLTCSHNIQPNRERSFDNEYGDGQKDVHQTEGNSIHRLHKTPLIRNTIKIKAYHLYA